jgi:hypothetical protein
MKRRLFILLAACACLFQLESLARQQAVFRAGTEVVLVPVSVTRGRHPVTGLGAADFDLRDRGVRQQIDAVALEGHPIDVTFVGGAVLESQVAQLERARTSSESVRRLLGPRDRLRVIRAGERVTERPMRPAAEAAGFGPILRTRGSSLNDALAYALMWPVDPDRRHLIIAYASGLESWSTLSAEIVPEIAARADAVVHAVVPGPPPAALSGAVMDGFHSDVNRSLGWCCSGVSPHLAAEWRATYDAIDNAVRATGGSLHYIGAGAEAFQRILDDFRSSYLLRYTPRGVDRAGWHEISLRIARPGSYTVRARKGYEGR